MALAGKRQARNQQTAISAEFRNPHAQLSADPLPCTLVTLPSAPPLQPTPTAPTAPDNYR